MTAKTRLATYRRAAAETKNPAFADWRKNRYILNRNGWRKTAQQFTRSDDGRKIYADNFEIIGEKLADSGDIVRLDYSGWFCDSWQNGVIRGAVVKLRSPVGCWYIPATYCSEWDGITLYMRDAELVIKGGREEAHQNASEEAARSADHYAEREAEQSRDDDAKYQAEQQAENLRDDIKAARAHVRELCAAIKAQRKSGEIMPAICAALVADIRRAAGDIRRDIRRIIALKENYWLAIE